MVQLADDASVDRDQAIQALYAAGIGCSVHYVPLHQHPYWRDRYGLTADQFPRSQRLFERCISLPLYTRMTEQDQDRVISVLREVLRA